MFVYRILRDDEYQSLMEGKDILAKDPSYKMTIEQHISGTKGKTPWISASKEFHLLLSWLKNDNPGAGIIRIDLDKVSEYYDVSTKEKCFENGVRAFTPRNWAIRRQEVVIKNVIPYEACTIIIEAHAAERVFSRKSAGNWKRLYDEIFLKKVSKKRAVKTLIGKIKKQARPNLSIYRLKQIIKFVIVLEGITENSRNKWDSAYWAH